MNFTLIVCTYMRPQPLLTLLKSVAIQSVVPNQIIIVDGSTNAETQQILEQNNFENLQYFLVDDDNRGLTKQRNFGLSKVNETSEIIFFLDDDIVLNEGYFEKIIKTYQEFPYALGVGGYIVNESKWQFVGQNYKLTWKDFCFDGWKTNDGIRFVARKFLRLDSDEPPGYQSNFSHGRSLGFLPPSDKVYAVEQLMGGVSSFRKLVFKTHQFSEYFEGYGLYEDADFTIRVSKSGQLYLNTAATLNHYHASSGRPNQYRYGKMVVRNGWYVWRVRNPKPIFVHRFKWNAITILLILIRFSNTFTPNINQSKAAFTEAVGRTVGLFSLLINRPKQKK
jgi:GT2 family glycosyltransferase